MNENNIFDSIDDALAERPSGLAWHRLESRLEQRVAERDGYRDRLRKQWTRQMIFTVGAVACLLFAAVFTVFYSLPKNEAVGKRAIAFAPVKAEKTASGELVIQSSDSVATDNRVLAKKDVQTENPTLSPAAMSDAKPIVKQRKTTTNDILLPPQSVTSNDNTTGWNRKEVRAEAKQEAPKKIAEMENLPARNSVNSMVLPNKSAAIAPSKNMNTNSLASPDYSTKKTARKARKSAERDAAKTDTKASDDSPAKSPTASASIADLYWLLGNWHNETDTRTPYEAWSSVGKYELRGTGYLVGAKGDTSRLETFKIKQEGNSLVLYLPVDITGSIYRYELQSYEAYQWTFENEEMSFPQEIVLHRLSKDNFVFTMQNTDPHRVQNTKMRFQDPRISTLEDRTSRTMSRLNKR